MNENKYMKLSTYAKNQSVGYRTVWNRFKAGKIIGVYLSESGSVMVPIDKAGVSLNYDIKSKSEGKDGAH